MRVKKGTIKKKSTPSLKKITFPYLKFFVLFGILYFLFIRKAIAMAPYPGPSGNGG
jgi:hypothetical protein